MQKTAYKLCEEELFYSSCLSHLADTVLPSLIDEEALSILSKIHKAVSARYSLEQYSPTNPYLVVNSQYLFDGARASVTINMIPSPLGPIFRSEMSTIMYNKVLYRGGSLSKAALSCQEALDTYLEEGSQYYSAEEVLEYLQIALEREQR